MLPHSTLQLFRVIRRALGKLDLCRSFWGSFHQAWAKFRDKALPLVDMLDLLLQGMFGIVKFVTYLAPLAAFGAMAYTVGQYGVASLVQLAQFTAELWIVSILFVIVVLGVNARLCGFSLFAVS